MNVKMETLSFFDVIPQELNEIISLYVGELSIYLLTLKEIAPFYQIVISIKFWKRLFNESNLPVMNKDIINLFEGIAPHSIKKFSEYTPDQLFYIFIGEYTNLQSAVLSYERYIENMNFTMKVSVNVFNNISFFYDNIDASAFPFINSILYQSIGGVYLVPNRYTSKSIFIDSDYLFQINKNGKLLDFNYAGTPLIVKSGNNFDFLKKIFLYLFYYKIKFDILYKL